MMCTDDVVKKARDDYESGGAFWAAELILALEDRSPHYAMAWAIASAKAIMTACSLPDLEQCNDWLDSLSESQSQNPDELNAMAYTIWYARQDDFGKAIVNLYRANAKWIDGNKQWYRTYLVTAMTFFGEIQLSCAMSENSIFSLFEEYLYKA
ncbi:MAG: hypothetical protein AAGC72_16035 [Planctomycetota bacterium]